MENKEFEPHVFDTKSHKLKAYFENYEGDLKFENGEPEFDEIREEIAEHYGVPFEKEEHIFIVDNKLIDRQRHARAFSVVQRKKEGSADAWYIDGRLPHAVLLRRLYNHYGIPKDDQNEAVLGFLDPNEFEGIKEIQKKAKESGVPITWFVRETVPGSKINELLGEFEKDS